MTIKSGDEVSDHSDEDEEENAALTLAEKRKRWELPPHLLPTSHPRYKPLDVDESQIQG